jgi:hypothetical protein
MMAVASTARSGLLYFIKEEGKTKEGKAVGRRNVIIAFSFTIRRHIPRRVAPSSGIAP